MQSIPASQDEKVIIERKYSATPFGKMSDLKRMDAAEIMLVKIHSITGWELPAPDVFSILLDQVSSHLLETYPTVNVNEVDYAFRKYSANLKVEWGKAINIILFDKVMDQYLEERRAASAAEQHIKPAPAKQIGPVQNLSDEDEIELAKSSVRHFLSMGKDGNVDFIHNIYELLRRLELMPKPTVDELEAYRSATTARQRQLEAKDAQHFKGLDVLKWRQSYLQKLAVLKHFTT